MPNDVSYEQMNEDVEPAHDDQPSLQPGPSVMYNHRLDEEPKVGMEFDSHENAYEYYCKYAHRIGFSVRKQYKKRSLRTKLVKKVTFVCGKQGKQAIDKRRQNVCYHRPVTRIGCNARMTCLLQKNGKFKIVLFHADHNHSFVPSPAKHMIRSKRKLSFAEKAAADDIEQSGISLEGGVELLSTQAGGREHLGFTYVDYKNYIYTKRNLHMRKGDAGAMLEYFQNMKLKDSSFFYSMQLDEDDLITNIFWADSRSIIDYEHFGDVVCFDTTYRTNEYGRPFAPFVGVNHHKQTIIFGGALLYDETTESFKWLFTTFLSAMSGKQPRTILTDQSKAMASAIKQVFLETSHRLCVWHIYQNAAKHLSHVFHASNDFTKEFARCVYDYEELDEWMDAWNAMLESYDLKDNKWLKELYDEREKWAMVYGRHMFTADMKSTQRSESLNHILKQYLDPKHIFLRFFHHYGRLLKNRRYAELESDVKMRQTTPVLLGNVEMLKQASEVYTSEVFILFQHEYMKAWDCTVHKASKSETASVYRVLSRGKKIEQVVKFEAAENMVECSCNKFSFVGILCAHALKVLDKKNIKKVPAQYILKRWTKDAKDAIVKDFQGANIEGDPQKSMGKRFAYLSREFREIIALASEDKDMYKHASNILAKLLMDLQEMKKQQATTLEPQTSAQNCNFDNLHEYNDGVSSRPIRGIKSKPTVGRPRNRFKDPLENKKRRKSVAKTIKDATATNNVTSQKSRGTAPSVLTQDTCDISVQGCNNVEDEHPTNNFLSQCSETREANVDQGLHITHDTFQPTGGSQVKRRSSSFLDSLELSDHQMSFTQLLQKTLVSSTNLEQTNQDGEQYEDLAYNKE